METEEDNLRGRRPLPATSRAYLFVILEGSRPLAGGARFALDGVDEIVIHRGEARTATFEDRDGARRLALRLPSPSLSRLHARLRRVPEGWFLEDAGSRNGSYLDGRRVERGLVGPGELIEVGHAFLKVQAFPHRPGEALADVDGADLAAELPALRTLVPTVAAGLADLRRVARSSVSVLLTGETGTGKEVLARAIHVLSERPGPFVAVNCSTLTEGLAESQLFGHVKGAFSGAVTDEGGFVRAARTGTLLLDEVGDLGRAGQGALLRVIQDREVVPVGRARPETVDVRFIATTPRVLEVAVARDQFRSDLFARLTGYVHPLPPLRERREDLGVLVAALLDKAGVRASDRPRIAPELGLQLIRHAWPLNIRELEQVLVRSWLLADDGLMSADTIVLGGAAAAGAEHAAGQPWPPARGTAAAAAAWDATAGAPPLSPQDQARHGRLVEALVAARGNVTEAARALGMGRVQVHRLMKRLQVDAQRFRA
jgi:DNA-binding NtrC family response regulator